MRKQVNLSPTSLLVRSVRYNSLARWLLLLGVIVAVIVPLLSEKVAKIRQVELNRPQLFVEEWAAAHAQASGASVLVVGRISGFVWASRNLQDAAIQAQLREDRILYKEAGVTVFALVGNQIHVADGLDVSIIGQEKASKRSLLVQDLKPIRTMGRPFKQARIVLATTLQTPYLALRLERGLNFTWELANLNQGYHSLISGDSTKNFQLFNPLFIARVNQRFANETSAIILSRAQTINRIVYAVVSVLGALVLFSLTRSTKYFSRYIAQVADTSVQFSWALVIFDPHLVAERLQSQQRLVKDEVTRARVEEEKLAAINAKLLNLASWFVNLPEADEINTIVLSTHMDYDARDEAYHRLRRRRAQLYSQAIATTSALSTGKSGDRESRMQKYAPALRLSSVAVAVADRSPNGNSNDHHLIQSDQQVFSEQFFCQFVPDWVDAEMAYQIVWFMFGAGRISRKSGGEVYDLIQIAKTAKKRWQKNHPGDGSAEFEAAYDWLEDIGVIIEYTNHFSNGRKFGPGVGDGVLIINSLAALRVRMRS